MAVRIQLPPTYQKSSSFYTGADSDRYVCQAGSFNNIAAGGMSGQIWCRRKADTANQFLWSTDSGGNVGWTFYAISANGTIRLNVRRDTTDASIDSVSTAWPLNELVCLAFSWDSSVSPAGRIFVGGLGTPMEEVSYASQPDGSGAETVDSGVMSFGALAATPSLFKFNGDIARGQLWRRPSGLARLRKAQFAPDTVKQDCVFLGDPTQSGYIVDRSGHENHAVIEGAPLRQYVPAALDYPIEEIPFYIPDAVGGLSIPIAQRYYETMAGR